MADRKKRLVIGDVTNGRNQYLPPWAIKDTECVEALNVDWYKAKLGNKRGGMLNPTTTGMTMTGIISSIIRHVPTTSEAAAEFWAVDDSATPIINRLAGGTAWVAPTLKDPPTGNGWDFTFASINGKLAIAYQSAQDRLHFWDPAVSSVRRGGLNMTVAPTVANTGSGSYAATARSYRQRSTVQVGGITIRRSEPSPLVAFTPSGSGTAARVTQAAVINEGETHWEVEAATDGVTFYLIATVAIGTTTYDDSAAPSSYNSQTLSALTGVYTLQKSYKFIAADQNRLLGFGSYTAADKQSRLEISAVIGSSDIGDEERVDTTLNFFLDFDENDSGVATGLCGPILGSYFVFKERQVWQLTPTGSVAQPYRQDAISKSIGAVAHVAISRAEDRNGNSALYWMSYRGPYRWSINGLEYIGAGVEDFVLGGNATINLSAAHRIAVTTYHFDKRQVWFWWATGTSDDPNVGFVYDIKTGGWSRIPSSDLRANVRCATMFANTLGASMSRDLKPYVGQTGGNTRLWKCDVGNTDNGTPYQGYILTKAAEPGGAGFFGEVGNAIVLAKASPGVTITDTITADFGLQTVVGTADISPTKGETRVSVPLEGTGLSGIQFVQHQIGDAAPIANAWTLDWLVVPYEQHEAVSK